MKVIADYSRDGFYVAKNLLAPTEVTEVVQNLKDTFDDQLNILNLSAPAHIADSMKLLYKIHLERYKATVSSLWRKLSVYNLLHHVKIQDFVKEHFAWKDIVIPGGQVVLIMSESLKIPGGYFGFAPHQDYPSVQGSLDGFVVWIPLVDIDQNLYPMEIIPGSHTRGILPSFESDTASWTLKPEAFNEQEFVKLECNVGDVIFMSNFTVHRSSTSGDDRVRLACSTRYDNADEKTFIDRCYPTAYTRGVHRALMNIKY
jgi:ectoine hydroxylase-related dioxygenase (phytanoyl-CoA dioxygenase family)